MAEIPPPPMPPPPAMGTGAAQKGGLFGSKPAPQEQPSAATEQLTTLAGRLRVSEERMGEIRRKLLLIENNMLAANKKNQADIKILQNDIMEVKHTIHNVEDRIITVIKELRMMAPKEDLQILKKYIELWDPMKFVTREQVEKLLDEKLGKHHEEKPNYDSPRSTITKPKV
jgi:hypothetical protein